MQADYSSLGNQAFGEDADSLITVKYKSHQDALTFLSNALRKRNGVGVLLGPKGSGKTTIIRTLAEQLSRGTAIALVDGMRLKPRSLLTSMLSQYGVETNSEPDDVLLKRVSEFANHESRTYQPPILIIDNADRMYPSTLRVLNILAMLAELQQNYFLRIILTGHEGLSTLIESDGLMNIAQRSPSKHALTPLSSKETMIYLHARLQSAGSERADTVFPFDVCDRLREQSAGWPGLLNRYALEAFQRASDIPISVAHTYAPSESKEQPVEDIPVLSPSEPKKRLPPRLIITKDGETVADYTFRERKVLIGRSDFADILIDDDFVSKLHAVLLLYTDALVMLDLNSANGTTVNSVKVKKTVLKDDDIISLGHHRLKIENAPAISEELAEILKAPDTLKMKNLIDLRRQKARRTIALANRG